MITFLSSGGLGDILYALPVIQALGGGQVYVKRSYYERPNGDQYESIRELLAIQPGIRAVSPYDGAYPLFEYDPQVTIDYDLDQARKMPSRDAKHIIKSYFGKFFNRVPEDWNKPFLKMNPLHPPSFSHEFNLVHLTTRWRDNSEVNWTQVAKSWDKPTYFIGFPDEYKEFWKSVPAIPYLPTRSLLEMAHLIRDCSALYCNQSVGLVIAQGLGKEYWLERKPGKTNTLFNTSNEHLL